MKSILISLFIFTLHTNAFAALETEPLPNFHPINEQIYRGGRPTAKGMQILKDAGIKMIINLENVKGPVEKERQMARRLGIAFMSSPMSWAAAPSDEQVSQILTMMGNSKYQPVYLHCFHGRDRTGLVSALYRVLVEKRPARVAYREMLNLGFRHLFVTLEYYFRERTDFWDLNQPPPQFASTLNVQKTLRY